MYLFQYLFICFAPANVIGSKKSPRTRYWQFFDFWLQLLQSSTNKYEQRKTEYGGFNINTFNCLFCWHLTINLILYSYFMQVEHDSKWVFYEYILISLKTSNGWLPLITFLKGHQCCVSIWSYSALHYIPRRMFYTSLIYYALLHAQWMMQRLIWYLTYCKTSKKGHQRNFSKTKCTSGKPILWL